MATIDPTKKDLVAQMRRQYTALRTLRAAKWQAQITKPPQTDLAERTVTVRYLLQLCFVVPDCQPAALPRIARWRMNGDRLQMTSLATDELALFSPPQPQPWEHSTFTAAVGRRVTIAAPSTLDIRPESGDRAAINADRYLSSPQCRPPTYHIYLAGPAEWATWYGGRLPAFAHGYMSWNGQPTETGDLGRRTGTEVIINATATTTATPHDIEALLRHELGHVATLRGSLTPRNTLHWWLTEGIAEYIDHGRSPIGSYRYINAVRHLIRSGTWRGPAADLLPAEPPASNSIVTTHYGISYLAIRRIAERHGEQAMLRFFHAVTHEHQTRDAAARTHLGQPSLDAVAADCIAYIRYVAR